MTGAEAGKATLCTNCGTALTGKFCSGCGAPAEDSSAIDHREGWSSLTAELLSKPNRNGIFSVALSFVRHPVDTIIRLTDDPTYRSQWSFLTTCVAAQLTLVYVLLPRIFSALFNTPDTANSSAVITNEVVQYVGIAILTPIQYYVGRALGTMRRTPMSYVKLCVLSVSYGALLSSGAALLFFATGILALKTGTNVDFVADLAGTRVRNARRNSGVRRRESSKILGNVVADRHRLHARRRSAVVGGGLSGSYGFGRQSQHRRDGRAFSGISALTASAPASRRDSRRSRASSCVRASRLRRI